MAEDQNSNAKANSDATNASIDVLGNEGVAVIPVLFAVGVGLKYLPFYPDEAIPAGLAIVGGIIVCLLKGWTRTNFLKGMVLGTSTVGVHQLLYQPGILPSGL